MRALDFEPDKRERYGKAWPYKIMCMCLYGSVPGVRIIADRTVVVTVPKFCSWLKIPSYRVREYFEEMQRLGMIRDLDMARGTVIFKLVAPPALLV